MTTIQEGTQLFKDTESIFFRLTRHPSQIPDTGYRAGAEKVNAKLKLLPTSDFCGVNDSQLITFPKL